MDATRFRESRQVKGGYYAEVNLSAKDMRRFCIQAMESLGISTDWSVETT
jgi:hypothetical protein